MSATRDGSWLAAELERWSVELSPLAEVRASAQDGIRHWRCVGRHANALPVEVTVREGAIEVAFGEWKHRFEADDEGVSEAAELAACGLFGVARAEVHAVGERCIRFAVQFLVGGRWSAFETIGRTHLALWRRVTVTTLVNDFAPPSELELGSAGRLPSAPWIGVLDDPRAPNEPRELHVDGELDLHPFSPKEVAAVVRAYIDACLEKGVYDLRIVHGKGIGNLRRTVHALLDDHPAVESYRLGGMGEGSWGATLVTLKRSPR